jgi:hypothetical protein
MSEMTLDQVRDWHLKRSKDLMKYAADPMKLRSANLHRKSVDAINAEIKRRDALQDEQFMHAIVSITDILDGKDTGVGVCNEPWQSVRMRLIELVKRQASAQGETVPEREALEAIKRLPRRPFPDPIAHSWEAFGRAVMGAFTDARMIAIRALSAAPEPEAEGDVLDPADLQIESYPDSVGSMHVGISRGVRITHKPTGITVTCAHERSQHKNRDVVMRALRAAIGGAK